MNPYEKSLGEFLDEVEKEHSLMDHAANEMLNEPQEISKLQQRFLNYHAKNPHVYALFKKFAKDAKSKGRKHFGAKAVIERVRWSVNIDTDSLDEFKLNNNYTSRYVRMLEQEDPSFLGFFRKRELRA